MTAGQWCLKRLGGGCAEQWRPQKDRGAGVSLTVLAPRCTDHKALDREGSQKVHYLHSAPTYLRMIWMHRFEKPPANALPRLFV